MSGWSSTIRTRNAVFWAASRVAAASSLIGHFHLREEIGVAGDARFERGAVAAARAVLDLLADRRDESEAVRIADTFHAMPELTQLLEVRRGKRHPQGVDFLVAVLEKHGDQIFEIFRDGDFVAVVGHEVRKL